ADIRADLQRLKRDTDTGRAAAISSGSVPVAQETAAPSAAHTSSSSRAPAVMSPGSMAHAPSSASSQPAASAVEAPAAQKSHMLFDFSAGVVLAARVGGFFFFRSRQSAKLTEKDAVLLTDFVNTTGDGVFDGALKQALATQLEQSPYLNLLPESRV